MNDRVLNEKESLEPVSYTHRGVAQVTTVYFAKVHVVLLGCLAQEAVQQLVGIAAPQVYVAAGVSAFQPLYLHFAAEISCRYVHFPVEMCIRDSTDTARFILHKDLCFTDGIILYFRSIRNDDLCLRL